MKRIKYNEIYSEFSKNPKKYVEKCEAEFESFLEDCVRRIKSEGIKRVFVCGQSASGKTTSALRLAEKLNKSGHRSHIVELDDFFLPRGKQRLNKKGKEDFESIFALDLKSIYEFGDSIRANKKVVMPQFDFKTGEKGEEAEIAVGKDDILVIEGIHSFNRRITDTFGVDGKNLNIFVTVNSCVEFDDTTLSNTDLRFARRLIRDYHHRNALPDWTIELWHMVRAGEKRYAGGYIKKADILFDTFINYEIFILKKDFEFLARKGVESAASKGYYGTLLGKYGRIASDFEIKVPENSILNEFINI